MLRTIVALLSILSAGAAARATTADEISEVLAQAQTFYYEAAFTKSIDLLLPVDEALRSRPEQVPDKVRVKLQLALSYIGLNETERARTFLSELYALDPDYPLDALQFSPKVITLADEVRATQNEARCLTVRETTSAQLAAGNVTAVLNTLGSMKSKCTALAEIEPAAAEALYKVGLDSYKKGDFESALRQFQTVLTMAPRHDMAAQYTDLAKDKLQITTDRLFLDWTKHFEAREFELAAKDYRQLIAANNTGSAAIIDQARTEYEKILSTLVESSNRACATGDMASVKAIRSQISEVLPDPSVGDGVLARLSTCAKKECLQMNSQLVLTRLKTRFDPEIPQSLEHLLRQTRVTVRVQTRIDEKGDVTVGQADGPNPVLTQAVRSAVQRWKFSPVLDADGPRCVDTELPIVITL